VATAQGQVLTCTPDNENKQIFEMVHGTFGTLGTITKLTFRLMPAKPYIHMKYDIYQDFKSYQAAIWQHYQDQDVEYMDGLIYSPAKFVLCL
jgi:FAD/FMN-containing dehydrogenase